MTGKISIWMSLARVNLGEAGFSVACSPTRSIPLFQRQNSNSITERYLLEEQCGYVKRLFYSLPIHVVEYLSLIVFYSLSDTYRIPLMQPTLNPTSEAC